MYLTLLTNYGQARLATAIATGTPLNLTTLVVGDGSGSPTTPATSQTALVNQVHSVSLNSVSVDSGNPNYVIAEGVIPAAVGGWTVREAGILDNTGALFAVCNFPDTIKPILTDGSVRDLVIRVIMQVSNAAAVTLLIDPSVVLASQSWVLTQGYLPKSGGIMTGHITQPLAPTLGEHVPNKDYVDAKTGVDSVPIGFIDQYGSATPPPSFLLNDGSAISRTTYATLFARFGTSFGAGDGSTTFNLPNVAAVSGRYSITKALLLTNVDAALVNQAANTYCRLDGTVDMTGLQKLSGAPAHALHGATKGYADSVAAAAQAASQPLLGFTPANKAGETFTGPVILNADPSASLGAVTKQYADTQDALRVALTAFTGANQSFGAGGYQKLPGGMILQWGYSATDITTEATTTITFPIAFPTAALFATAITRNTGANTNNNASFQEVSLSATQYAFFNQAAPSSQSLTTNGYRWFAIGY
jgi:phage-related tail fiber protein